MVGFNDIDWFKKVLVREKNVYYLIGNLLVEDIVLFFLVNYIIMFVGIFGWWIGWMV